MAEKNQTEVTRGVTVRPIQMHRILLGSIKHRLPTLIAGAPGVGKSEITQQACEEAEADMILSHPVVSDPTYAKGLPWPMPDGKGATFLPFGDLARAIAATRTTVWFLDDLGQASPAVQASYMQLVLARQVNGHALPECVTFVAATNRRTDRAGVSGILEPVKSRFTIYNLAPTLDDWCEWAVTADVDPMVIAFCRLRPDLLHSFTPTADMENSPNPRTWAKLSRCLNAGISREDELAVASGNVGEGAAGEFIAFLRIAREIPDPDAVLANPDEAVLPTQPASLYALSAALAYRATHKNFSKVYRVAERLLESKRGEFGVLLIRDAYQRDKTLAGTPTFTKIQGSDLGKLILRKE